MGLLGVESGMGKIMMFTFMGALAIAVLELIFAFIQTTHIMGFIFALILAGGCGFMIFLISKASKDGNFEERKMIFIIAGAVLGVIALYVGISFLVKIITLIASPNLEKEVESNNLRSNNYFNISKIEDTYYFKAHYPSLGLIDKDANAVDLDKLTDCLAEGVQKRIQTKDIDLLGGHIEIHVNSAEAFLGLVVDTGIYTDVGKQISGGFCMERLSGEKDPDKSDRVYDCLERVAECGSKSSKSSKTLQSQ